MKMQLVYISVERLRFWLEVVKQRVAKLAGVSRVRINKGIAELSIDKVLNKNTFRLELKKLVSVTSVTNNVRQVVWQPWNQSLIRLLVATQ